jgi:hypothetical protein
VTAKDDTFATSAAASVLLTPLSDASAFDVDPLPLDPATLGGRFCKECPDLQDHKRRYFLFASDRKVGGAVEKEPPKRLWVGLLPDGSGGAIHVAQVAGTNLETGGEGADYAPAYASGPQRLFWVRRRKSGSFTGVPQLVTAKLQDSEGIDPNDVQEVTVPDTPCAFGYIPARTDLASWVTPNGAWLWFHDRCTKSDAVGVADSRLYRLALDPVSGQPTGTPPQQIGLPAGAVPLTAQSPSLSPDQCTLYFESQNALYYARRQ